MNDFKNQSPWGTPPPGGGSGGNGGFRRGPTPPNLDEILKKIQETINRLLPGGSGGTKPIIVGLIVLQFLPCCQLLFSISCHGLRTELGHQKRRPVKRLFRTPNTPFLALHLGVRIRLTCLWEGVRGD